VLSYQWYVNTTNSSTGGTELTGATNASFAIPTAGQTHEAHQKLLQELILHIFLKYYYIDNKISCSNDSQFDAFALIPTALTVGTYYYFCEVRATGATSVRSNVAVVSVNAVNTVNTNDNGCSTGIGSILALAGVMILRKRMF